MDRVAEAILKHRKTVLFTFLGAALICLVLMPLVNINYNLADYLPEDAPSTVAMNVLDQAFDEDIPNASVMIRDVSIPEALKVKAELAAASGVDAVLWLDDVIDVRQPLEMADSDTVEAWYKGGDALFMVTVDRTDVGSAIASLREVVGDRGSIAGDAVNLAAAQGTVMGEIPTIILLLLPLVIIILMLSTSSWFEPLLFLAAIGVAILINEGTNIVQGNISFVTRATSAILQLAVSMDYAVFLLHGFARFRGEGYGLGQAMQKAMVQSFSAIAASAATTVLGFLVLVLMRFRIGPDMGWVLAKGILLSFISVTVLLPVLALSASELMDKTHHRPFLPSFDKFGRLVVRICMPLAAVVVLLFIPGYLGQAHNDFIYGSSGMHSEGSAIKREARTITDRFGDSVQMVILVPEGDTAAETALGDALSQVPDVKSVVSYDSMVGAQIPEGFLTPEQAAQFRSGGYSRLVLSVATRDEGEAAYQAVENVRQTAQRYYGDTYYLTGQSVVNYDLKETITGDNTVVSIAAIVAVGLVLLATFRSVSLPFLLLLTIEGAIWINLSIPYFTGAHMNYIGYQIVSSVQLGATIDYAILFTQNYLNNRRMLGKKESVRATVGITAPSILTPALILAVAGFALGSFSSNGIISQLGIILGRGALISAAMVLLFLPALLALFDPLIKKTTFLGKNKEMKA